MNPHREGKLRVLDLFSGIGCMSLGLDRTGGFQTVAFCENEPFPAAVFAQHWPGIPNLEDVTTAEFTEGMADVVVGGFPCQDLSDAGLRAGLSGERSGLYRELVRAIRVVRPKYAIVENVAALLNRGMGTVLGDMAEIGYDAEWHCLRASSIGAPFEGDRVYIFAAPHEEHGKAWLGLRPSLTPRQILVSCARNRAAIWLETTSRSARMGNGFSDRVDRRQRTECCGNAVVPQAVETFGRAILEAEGMT